jgi:hypothetical protein
MTARYSIGENSADGTPWPRDGTTPVDPNSEQFATLQDLKLFISRPCQRGEGGWPSICENVANGDFVKFLPTPRCRNFGPETIFTVRK